MEKSIGEIERKSDTMTPAEIENRIRRAIEYLRELVRLSARRLHLESCPVLRREDLYFTPAGISMCLDRIQEFDPRIFQNDRAKFFGKPSVLIIPGNGNSVYDWKNNMLLVPLIAPAGDFMGSIAAGVIEYKLDVDEDKVLLNSYAKISEYRHIRSVFRLKEILKKDYVVWMTSEYKGYRVLSRDVKRWFEHEIAPGRKEIYCPPELRTAGMTPELFRSRLAEAESRLKMPNPSESDLWSGGILFYHDGRFDEAFTCMQSLVERKSSNQFVYYNYGHMCMQTLRKQDAISGFREFIIRNPQSWWAQVAGDHIRSLQQS
jgi:hypothetical protein